MRRGHAIALSLLLGAGVAAGAAASFRTVHLGLASAAGAPAVSQKAIAAATTAHGLLAGSDSSRHWAQMLYISAVGAVSTAVAFRVLSSTAKPRAAAPRRAAPSSEHSRRRAVRPIPTAEG